MGNNKLKMLPPFKLYYGTSTSRPLLSYSLRLCDNRFVAKTVHWELSLSGLSCHCFQASRLDAALLSNHWLLEKRLGGNSTHHNPVSTTSGEGLTILGAFQVPRGIKRGVVVRRATAADRFRRRRQFKENYTRVPASAYSAGMPKKAPNQQLNAAGLPRNVRKPRKHCAALNFLLTSSSLFVRF